MTTKLITSKKILTPRRNQRISLKENSSPLEQIVTTIIHSSAFMGLVGAALMYVTMLLFNLSPDSGIIITFGLISYSIYVLDRLGNYDEDFINHIDRSFFVEVHRKFITITGVISYLLAFSIALPLGITGLLLVAFPLIAVILYSGDLPSYIPFGRVKNIFLIKNLFIAFLWTTTLIGLNMVYSSSPFSLSVASVAIFIFSKVFLNTIVFDIRDIEGDRKKKVRTLPVYLGIYRTKLLLVLLNLLLGVFVILAVQMTWLPKLALVINIGTLYSLWYIFKIGRMNTHFLCDVIVEGEDILLAALAYLGTLIFL